MTIRVLHVLPDLAVGGGQQVVHDAIASGQRDQFEYQVAFIAPVDEMRQRFEAIGIKPIHVGGHNPAITTARLARLIRRSSADIVHVHSPVDRKYGHAAALMTGRPVVSHLHSPWDHRGTRIPEGARSPLRLLKQIKAGGRDWIERRVVENYISVSSAVSEFFADRGLGDVTLIDNGIDVSKFKSGPHATATARTAIGVDAPTVMSVARLADGKGHLDLIEALAGSTRHDWQLVLVGSGPLADDITALAADRGVDDRLHMLGSRDDVPEILPAADIWVLASSTEGLPISVMEAMAAARAIVCYHLPTLAEMLSDGSGILIPHEATALASTIDGLLGDEEKRVELGRAAATRSGRHYDARLMASSIEAVYRRTLEK